MIRMMSARHFGDATECKSALSLKHRWKQCEKTKESQDVPTCKLRNIGYKSLRDQIGICSSKESTKMNSSVRKR